MSEVENMEDVAFVAEGGFKVTRSVLERWAKDADEGRFRGEPGEIFVGRPPLSDEELVVVTFKERPSVLSRLDEKARRSGVTRSELLRDAVRRELATS